MKQRGRQSASSLSILPVGTVLDRVPRPKPPHDLTDEEVEVWRAVVDSQEADWFTPATTPLLAQYCRHVIGCRRIGELIERATSDPNLKVKDYDRLLRMQHRESLAVTTVATKLRITQQSITTQRGNKKHGTAARKPWEA